jgi:CheY-like chemotaxis protein
MHKIIETHVVDLIISDWYMPITNGLELLKAARKNSKTANTPLLCSQKTSMKVMLSKILH